MLLFCLFIVPFLILFMQNCSPSSSSDSTTVSCNADCSYDLVCADPTNNGDQICISGRVVDSVDRTANLSSTVLSSVEIRLYDALSFVSNPTGAVPIKTLTSAAGNIDSCGRYTTRINRSADIPFGFVAMVTTDLTGSGSNYVLSSTVRPVSAYKNLVGIRNYLVSTTQDATWSTDAGLSGSTFASAGTIAVRYYQGGNSTDPIPGVGISGVTPTWNGSSNAAIDYFFSDTGLKTMQTIAASQTVTGTNGVAFFQPSAGFGTLSAGSSCNKLDGTSGTTTVGSASYSTAAGVIAFQDLEVTCN